MGLISFPSRVGDADTHDVGRRPLVIRGSLAASGPSFETCAQVSSFRARPGRGLHGDHAAAGPVLGRPLRSRGRSLKPSLVHRHPPPRCRPGGDGAGRQGVRARRRLTGFRGPGAAGAACDPVGRRCPPEQGHRLHECFFSGHSRAELHLIWILPASRMSREDEPTRIFCGPGGIAQP